MDGQALSQYVTTKRENDPDLRDVSIQVCLRHVFDAKFNILGFGAEEVQLDAGNEAEPKSLCGVDAFFEWSMFGYVSYPEPFNGVGAEILVNPLGSSDYFSNCDRGIVGDGYSNTSFVFRLYLPLNVSEAFLRRVNDLGRDTGQNPDLIEMSFDLIRFKYYDRTRTTGFEIRGVRS